MSWSALMFIFINMINAVVIFCQCMWGYTIISKEHCIFRRLMQLSCTVWHFFYSRCLHVIIVYHYWCNKCCRYPLLTYVGVCDPHHFSVLCHSMRRWHSFNNHTSLMSLSSCISVQMTVFIMINIVVTIRPRIFPDNRQ